MASSAANRAFIARAAAILTTGEVAGTSFDLNEAHDSEVDVQLDFTVGSLTNGIFRFYVSVDGTNWYTHFGPSAAALTQTLTANGALSIPVSGKGWKFLRVSVQGTGTVTSSSATVTVRYLRRGSQG
jgi:hypothetical protein